jgi:hypothetical protein
MTHQASREPTYLSSICGICECETWSEQFVSTINSQLMWHFVELCHFLLFTLVSSTNSRWASWTTFAQWRGRSP